jgi:hypothetical protein
MKNFLKRIWNWLLGVNEEYGKARAAAEMNRHSINNNYHKVIKKYY